MIIFRRFLSPGKQCVETTFIKSISHLIIQWIEKVQQLTEII
jgi:hypothetical protein